MGGVRARVTWPCYVIANGNNGSHYPSRPDRPARATWPALEWHGEHREEDLKERGEEGAQGHWVSLAPEVKTRERHAEEACRVLRQQLPVAVEEYVSEQLEGKRKREGEDDWPAPRRGDIAGSWSWKGAEGIT